MSCSLGSNSLRSKKVMDSTPSHRFFQKSSTESAPGKRPVMPMIATAEEEVVKPKPWLLQLTALPSMVCEEAVICEARADLWRSRFARERTVVCSKTDAIGSSY